MSDIERQDLRHVLQELLASSRRAALPARAFRRSVETELYFRITDEDVTQELEFLAGLTSPFVSKTFDQFGATTYWQITSAGLLDWERRHNRP